MGLFKTHWEAEFGGGKITVDRNEVTRGIRVSYGGKIVAEKVVTLVGLADLEGHLDSEGKSLPVHVSTDWGSTCHVRVDGKELNVTRTQLPRIEETDRLRRPQRMIGGGGVEIGHAGDGEDHDTSVLEDESSWHIAKRRKR